MNELTMPVEVQNEIQTKSEEFSLLAEYQLALIGGGNGAASLD